MLMQMKSKNKVCDYCSKCPDCNRPSTPWKDYSRKEKITEILLITVGVIFVFGWPFLLIMLQRLFRLI